ncbi:MAG: redoxin, partial [Planctomycetota bacterium]
VQATTSPGCELFYEQPIEVKTTVTYHNRISRIIQANCIECHRDGGIAPIALETYAQVKDYAGMIRSVVRREVMPPWFAEPQAKSDQEGADVLHWANDRSLSDQDKKDLFAWIESGAPEGDSDDAPLPKSFPGGWLIGKPDREFAFRQPVPVKATGIMPYKHITVETNLDEDKWVRAIEVRPGKLDVVHHVIVSVKAGEGEFDERDGYWGAYVPGNSTLVYPEGYGRRLPKGAKLRFQMHYTPNGTATEDVTRIGIIYCKEPPKHEVRVAGIANPKINIPAHASHHPEEASVTLPSDVEVLAFLPHMHLRGKAALYELESDGETEKLLDIPRYDFNWQLRYRLAEPRTLQQGDTIRFTAWYDNSKNNPANPNPNTNVDWGQQTEDEMHLGYVEYTIPGAKPGEPVAGLRSGDRGRRSGGDAQGILRGIKALDRNRDGKLTKSEVPQKYQELFERLDANGDEVLTIQEAREVIRQNSGQ